VKGFIPLEINMEGDNAWPDLELLMKRGEVAVGMMTHITILPNGMESGKPSVAIRGKCDDQEVVLETSWNLLYSAAKAFEARYGGAV
jgi:hypothetical protein